MPVFFTQLPHNSLHSTKFHQRKSFWWALLGMIIAFFLVHHFFSSHRGLKPALSVVVAKVKKADVPIFLYGLGTVTPAQSITIKPQITGRLLKLHFRDGQMVKAGDLLAEMDAQSYAAQLMQYQGQLERDQASLTNAQLDLQRYEKLSKQNSASKQQVDTQASLVKQIEGTVLADQGLLQNAKVNLDYARIVAPVSGWIGIHLVDEGNLIQPSDPGIAIINVLDPITVVFSLPSNHVQEIFNEWNAGKKLSVEIYDGAFANIISSGLLSSIDNTIDPTTGTIKLQADFANPEAKLFPNQFVNVALKLKTLTNALVVPTEAIQHGVEGAFVFVVKDEKTLVRKITANIIYEALTVVEGDIKVDDAVVVEGADKLLDGMAVTVVNKDQPTTDVAPTTHKRHKKA